MAKARTARVLGIQKLLGIATKPRRQLKGGRISQLQKRALLRRRDLERFQRIQNTDPRFVLQQFRDKKLREQMLSEARNQQLSQSVRNQLDKVLEIQNKGKKDDDAQQRRQRERRILGSSMNLMKAHENLRPVRLDFSGVSGDNILTAENSFKENPENNILRPRGRSILDTGGDNTLSF